MIRTFIVNIDIFLESVTYNYLCEKICCGKYSVTFGIICLCALFSWQNNSVLEIILNKFKRIFFAFLRQKLNFGDKHMLKSTLTHHDFCMYAAILLKFICAIFVSLHELFNGSKFFNIMMDEFFFRTHLYAKEDQF